MAERADERNTARARPRGRLRAQVLLLAMTAAVAPGLALPAAAQEVRVKDAAGQPDYSAVTSGPIARRLVGEGLLVEVSLFPVELGGPDDPANRVYLPAAVAEARDRLVGTVRRFAEDGLIDRLEVLPEYDGDSIVPRRIVMSGWSDDRGDEPAFTGTIEAW